MTNLTEMVFILDKSGSMSGLEGDTIGGFNAMLNKQKAVEGHARITTVLFNNNYTLLHDRIDVRAVSPISDNEYYVGGTTALLDAIGRTIDKIVGVQKNTVPEYRADKVVFVITTDGIENSSHIYDYDKIKAMVELEKSKYGWEFIFLGANIDAVETAGRFGIAPDRAQNFHSDAVGTRLNYEVVGDAIASLRTSELIPPSWNVRIKDDFHRRDAKKK